MDRLEKQGFMKKIKIPDSAAEAGSYIETYFFDENEKFTTEQNAVIIRMKTFDKDGNMIRESYLRRKPN